MEHLRTEYGDIPSLEALCIAKPGSYGHEGATFEKFHKFPEDIGWKVLSSGKLEEQPNCKIPNRSEFLQTWLFFGLAFTVLREGESPLLEFNDLLQNPEAAPLRISTDKLPAKLKRWVDWETTTGKQDVARARMRIIRLSLVLKKARTVVRKYFSYEMPDKWNDNDNYSDTVEKDKLHMNDEQALSMMLLGEALTAVYTNIMKVMSKETPWIVATGWQNLENEGWGQPRYVILHMQSSGWCPRNIHLLRRQLGSKATLLLCAYLSHQGSVQLEQGIHKAKKCTADICNVVSERKERKKTVYATAHHRLACPETSDERKNCTLIGPDNGMEEIENILDQEGDDAFPLLKFTGSKDNFGLEVKRGTKAMDYVTVSHVWSDGYGNETENKLWKCTLKFIWRLLASLPSKDPHVLFWMDTLVIPATPGHASSGARKRKKKAIRQIHDVFRHAKECIVLDGALVNLSGGGRSESCQTSLKLIASGWTRRLWTLQEAYLSKRLYVAFKEQGPNPLRNVHDLQRDNGVLASDATSISAAMIDQELSRSIMWEDVERLSWDRNAQIPGITDPRAYEERRQADVKRLSTRISSSWRAARWRTTSNKAHETIALSALLGLPAAQMVDRPGRNLDAKIINMAWDRTTPNKDMLEKLMREFWITIDLRHAIPAGIIFVPGAKMSLPGFGWAPLTFMTPEELHIPDPLTSMTSPASLEKAADEYIGLSIKCPGYLLHMDNNEGNRQRVLSSTDSFEFPVDSSFIEWYSVKHALELARPEWKEVVSRDSQLAIITPHEYPKEDPPEHGLLLEVYKTQQEAFAGPRTFYAQILSRVVVRRLGHQAVDTHYLTTDQGIFGESLGASQSWCIDGFSKWRFENKSQSGVIGKTFKAASTFIGWSRSTTAEDADS